MEPLPFTIPVISKDLRRTQFRFHISRNPVAVLFRSKPYSASCAEITEIRKAQLAGITDEVADINMNIALEIGAIDPIPLKDVILIADAKFLIMSVLKDVGTNCYTLSLKKYNL